MATFNPKCYHCDGQGVFERQRYECCGHYNYDGECCGFEVDAIYHEECRQCNGYGTDPTYWAINKVLKKLLKRRYV